ncbi:MAG: alpha-glucan family phosphorylase [Elusimicrobiota bacterium]
MKEIKKDKSIAYFSMEIGIDSRIPTYSGGLGVLAGDTLRSFADLKVPVIAVTLLHRKGYFYQKLDATGNQMELPVQWTPSDFLELLPVKITVEIENRKITVQAWRYNLKSVDENYFIPILFLDTDIPANTDYDRTLTNYLYGGDEKYRLAQEIVLGIGGVRMLRKLSYTDIKKYHMNEGHASLLVLELLRNNKRIEGHMFNFDEVRNLCVFTTHTPVPAGHDKFSYDLVRNVLGEFIPLDVLKTLAGEENLNMTLLALNLSQYINGVAKKHGKISREMFPDYPIDSITNGVHPYSWASESFRKLYNKYIPGWTKDPFTLRYIVGIPKTEIWDAHTGAKKKLIDYINKESNTGMDYETFTIGFARRSSTYKRAGLLFFDIDKLIDISKKAGKIQIVFAGKAHPKDMPGKGIIKGIFEYIRKIKNDIKMVYLENYDMELGKMITSGVDLWLNTPLRPKEASGTSGMKASLNGVPNFSILDGWWIEGCIEGVTGWSIGGKLIEEYSDEKDARDLYNKLENIIIPMFYKERERWLNIMQYSIAFNASFFNTHRMVHEYVLNAYLD